MKKNKQESFEEKFLFLENLSNELSQGSVSLDDLIPKMKEASKAIKICKEVLSKTQIELKEVEKEFEGLMTDED